MKQVQRNHAYKYLNEQWLYTDRLLHVKVFLTFTENYFARFYTSGDDAREYKVGFAIDVLTKCGGKFYADHTLKNVRLDSFTEDNCEYIIETKEGLCSLCS